MEGILRPGLSRFPSVLALLAGFQLYCDDGERLTTDPAVEVQSFFTADTSDAELADQIGSVRHARLTTGSEIVVLDEYEPFIKVLDRRGHLIRSFGRAGSGPGELERPRWLAVQGDSALAVVDRTRISEFTIDGEFLAFRRLPRLSLLGITDHCAAGWIVFGTGHVAGSEPAGENPWLLAIPSIAASRDSTAQDSVLYRDSAVPVSTGWPGTNVASGGGRFIFLRQDPLPRTLFEGNCATGEVREVEHGLEFAGPDQREMLSGPNEGRFLQVRLNPGPRPAGIGLLSGGILVARRPPSRLDPTVLSMIGRSDSLVIQVEESHVRLEDARPGVGALFSTAAPWPRVVFVPESTLLAAF